MRTAQTLLRSVVLGLLIACGPSPEKQASTARMQPSGSKSSGPPLPATAVSLAPSQVSLYGVIVAEFVRLGWPTVCVGANPFPTSALVGDPPAEVGHALKNTTPAFRRWTDCYQVTDSIIDTASGRDDAVLVRVIGTDHDGDDLLVRMEWCCWTGFGTFRMRLNQGIWSLKRTEDWFQS